MNRLVPALVLIYSCSLLAQSHFAQTQTASDTRITFQQRWPAADPQWFELVVQSDGHASYRSQAHQDANSPADPPADPGDDFSFTLSPRAQQQLFAVASNLPRFQDSLDKLKVAFTGTKTLRYDDSSGNFSILTYKNSSAPQLAALTDLLQSISRTVELAQTLQFQSRFDKLAIDSTLRSAEQLNSTQSLAEPQILQPVLTRIANDSTLLNSARRRARAILQSTPR